MLKDKEVEVERVYLLRGRQKIPHAYLAAQREDGGGRLEAAHLQVIGHLVAAVHVRLAEYRIAHFEYSIGDMRRLD